MMPATVLESVAVQAMLQDVDNVAPAMGGQPAADSRAEEAVPPAREAYALQTAAVVTRVAKATGALMMPATVLEAVVAKAMAQQQESTPRRSHLRRPRLAQSLGSGPVLRAH